MLEMKEFLGGSRGVVCVGWPRDPWPTQAEEPKHRAVFAYNHYTQTCSDA
jgi:hypothetical protein